MNTSASGRRIVLRAGSYEAHIVTVGAGHLVGPDSLQVELAKLGVIAERQ